VNGSWLRPSASKNANGFDKDRIIAEYEAAQRGRPTNPEGAKVRRLREDYTLLQRRLEKFERTVAALGKRTRSCR